MRDTVKTHIEFLKRMANSRGFIDSHCIPETMFDLARKMVSDCAERIKSGKGVSLAMGYSVAYLPRFIDAQEKLCVVSPFELEVLAMATDVFDIHYRAEEGIPLEKHPRYSTLRF